MLPEPAYFISGLVVGGIYAIFVLGLVLTYKSSRIFNFAQGAMAFFVAATYHSLHSEYGWSIPVAGVVAILAVAPLLGLFLWAVLFRLLTGTSETVRLVSTIGLYVALPALTVMIWGEEPFITAPGLAPTPVAVWHVFGVGINADQVAVLAAAIAIAVGMTLFLRYTTFGLQVRGAVDAPRVASLTGTNTALVSALSWMVGTTTAGLAGVLLSPIRGLDPFNFTLLLIASFAAVVIARLESLPLAFAGAMLLGLAQEISVKYIPNDAPQVIVSGLRPSIPFLIMAFFLFAYSGLGREKYARDRMPSSGRTTPEVSRAPLWRRLVAPVLVLLAVFVVVPDLVSGFWLGIVGSGIALSIIFLGQTVVTGEGGMISLCQITFAGIGAIASAQLITVHGWDPIPGVLVGALCAVPFGVLVALPILRLGGLYVALATLTFAVLVQNLLFPIEDFRNFGNGVDLLRPVVFGVDLLDDTNYYYAVFIVFVVCALGVLCLRRSTLGLKFAAIRNSEPASSTLGISITRVKVVAFAVSAFLAGLGGTLWAMYAYRVSPENFNVLVGLLWFAVVVTWGVRSPLGALLGGVSIAIFPEILSQQISNGNIPESLELLPTVLFGLGAIAVAREPRGVVVQMGETFRGLGRKIMGVVRRPARAEVPEPSGAVPT